MAWITEQNRLRFQSTPPLRGATGSPMSKHEAMVISIHAPLAGGDSRRRRNSDGAGDFNPRPPCGGRQRTDTVQTGNSEFQSTPPLRGATASPLKINLDIIISIHAPLAGGDRLHPRPLCGRAISIHAPLAGGDTSTLCAGSWRKYFNPRPPCGGRRHLLLERRYLGLFQSTPPLRGAT